MQICLDVSSMPQTHSSLLEHSTDSSVVQLILAIGGTTCIFFLTNILDEIMPIYAATPADHGGAPFFVDICPVILSEQCCTTVLVHITGQISWLNRLSAYT